MTAYFSLQRPFGSFFFFFWMHMFLTFVELIIPSISFVSIKQNLSILSFSHIISVSCVLIYYTGLINNTFPFYIYIYGYTCSLLCRCYIYTIFFADKTRGNLIDTNMLCWVGINWYPSQTNVGYITYLTECVCRRKWYIASTPECTLDRDTRRNRGGKFSCVYG